MCLVYLDHKCLIPEQGHLSAIGDWECTHRIITFFLDRASTCPCDTGVKSGCCGVVGCTHSEGLG